MGRVVCTPSVIASHSQLALMSTPGSMARAASTWTEVWTAAHEPGGCDVGEENLRGWVNTKEEAEDVRQQWQVANSITFVGDRKGVGFGNGILHLQNSDGELIRMPKIRFSDIGDDKVVSADGVPFAIVSRYTLRCMYGKDKNQAAKRRNEELAEKAREEDHPLPRKRKYQRHKDTKKKGCPAVIEMKEVIRFTDYDTNDDSGMTKRAISDHIRLALRNGEKFNFERRIYIRLPSETDHQSVHTLEKIIFAKSTMAGVRSVSLKSIEEAASRVKGHIHRTPVMTCGMLDKMAPGRNLFFKCELLQKTGSFKIRGALNAVSKLLENSPDASNVKVTTHSSGNFGQALAYAAQLKGIQACIVMPRTSPLCKKNAVQGYGAEVIECEPTEESRAEQCQRVQKETGASFFSPSQTFDVIAGQGTIGLELLEQVPELDAVVVPVGGGGMISGIATAVKSIKPHIKVYAAEPQNADDCAKSFKAKRLIPLPPGPVDTVADGLRVSVGENTWPVIRELVDDVITVTEQEIKDATQLVWYYLKQCIEPSAGVGLAAVLSQKFSTLSPNIKNVAIILCGGNVDINSVKEWI